MFYNLPKTPTVYLSQSLNKAEMEEFFKNLDVDKNGVVDFTEYVTFVASLSVLMSQE